VPTFSGYIQHKTSPFASWICYFFLSFVASCFPWFLWWLGCVNHALADCLVWVRGGGGGGGVTEKDSKQWCSTHNKADSRYGVVLALWQRMAFVAVLRSCADV
jgi:hypothetical protein